MAILSVLGRFCFYLVRPLMEDFMASLLPYLCPSCQQKDKFHIKDGSGQKENCSQIFVLLRITLTTGNKQLNLFFLSATFYHNSISARQFFKMLPYCRYWKLLYAICVFATKEPSRQTYCPLRADLICMIFNIETEWRARV